MAMSIYQGGSGFPFFGKATFDYICSQDMDKLAVIAEETPDPIIRKVIEEVCYDAYVYYICTIFPTLNSTVYLYSFKCKLQYPLSGG